MPGNQKTQTLDVEIKGSVSPSLSAAVGLSEREIKRLADATKTFNQLAAKSSLSMAGIAPEAAKVTSEIDRANRQAEGLAGTFRRIAEIASGVSIGEFVVSGLEKAADALLEAGKKVVEFGIHASEAASSYEMREKGIGQLLRDAPFAQQLMGQLQTTADA